MARLAPRMRPLYADFCPRCKTVHPRAEDKLPDDGLNEIQREFERLLKQLYEGKEPNNSMLAATGKLLAGRVAESYREIAVDYTTPDAAMLARLTRDVWQFSAAKNWQELRDLSLALKDENGKLREWNDFKEAADAVGQKYNEIWLRTEYNQAVAASQNAARWAEAEAEKDIIPNLEYQTVGDDAVRTEHARLNGIIKPMDDPFWTTHYPPNGWGCRCEAVQAPEGTGKVTPDEKMPDVPIPPMFRANLAQTGLIYPKNHPYYRGIPQAELRKAIAYLPPENTYLSTKLGEHTVDVHPLHGSIKHATGENTELGTSLKNCEMLLKHDPDARLKLLPIINENEMGIKDRFYPKEYVEKFGKKNGDCLYNGRVIEFEEPVAGSKNSIKNAIRSGKEQANEVFLMIKNGLTDDEILDIEDQIFQQLGHYKGQDLKVYLVNDDIFREYAPRKAKQD